MPREAVFDFTGAPPSQGGLADYVPPGRYPCRVFEITDGSSKAGNRMITARFEIANGEQKGKRLIDYFTLGVDEKKVGEKRLHAFFLAIGLPVGEKRFKLDLDGLVGKACFIETRDEKQAATGEYAERMNARINGYFSATASNGAQAAPAAPQATPVAAAAPVAAPVAQPEPVAVAAAVETVSAAPAQAAAPPEDVSVTAASDEVEDLFA